MWARNKYLLDLNKKWDFLKVAHSSFTSRKKNTFIYTLWNGLYNANIDNLLNPNNKKQNKKNKSPLLGYMYLLLVLISRPVPSFIVSKREKFVVTSFWGWSSEESDFSPFSTYALRKKNMVERRSEGLTILVDRVARLNVFIDLNQHISWRSFIMRINGEE